jgi:hypothetical protein
MYKMCKDNNKSQWTILGEYLGYPNCCIKEFEKGEPYFTKPELIQQMTVNGYVPCIRCASDLSLGIISYDELINKYRECTIPFKIQHTEDEKNIIDKELLTLKLLI